MLMITVLCHSLPQENKVHLESLDYPIHQDYFIHHNCQDYPIHQDYSIPSGTVSLRDLLHSDGLARQYML